MTGYAYEEKLSGDAVVSVEIKSVNSRFLDLSVSLPPYLAQLEPYFRNSVSEKVLRGKVDLNIRVRELNSAAEISADTGLARSYMEAARKVAAAAGAGAATGAGAGAATGAGAGAAAKTGAPPISSTSTS